MSDITVRRATAGDVPAMSTVMTASITQLCAADHGGDPAVVAAWIRNKTPEGVTAMLANPNVTLFVAERYGMVGAVGAITGADTVSLNYVAPAQRLRGLSRALLAHMETEMAARGTQIGHLTSTRTARDFYHACGWREAGAPEGGHTVEGYPMSKRLTA